MVSCLGPGPRKFGNVCQKDCSHKLFGKSLVEDVEAAFGVVQAWKKFT